MAFGLGLGLGLRLGPHGSSFVQAEDCSKSSHRFACVPPGMVAHVPLAHSFYSQQKSLEERGRSSCERSQHILCCLVMCCVVLCYADFRVVYCCLMSCAVLSWLIFCCVVLCFLCCLVLCCFVLCLCLSFRYTL